MSARIVGSALAVALLASVSSRADNSESLKQKVEKQLRKSHLEKMGDVGVEVNGGTVILTGFVTTLAAQRDAEKAADKVSHRVEDRIRVVPEQERTDREIGKAISEAILRYPRYSIFDSVSVGVDQGAVLLEGSVLQPYRKDDIEDLVARIPGVRSIEDKIWVQRVSTMDARLRKELADAIYGNSLFDRYAIQPHPPIHIIVDGGRVTLTGFVATPLEQAALGHIARQTLAFSVDNQVKLDSDSGEDHKKPSN